MARKWRAGDACGKRLRNAGCALSVAQHAHPPGAAAGQAEGAGAYAVDLRVMWFKVAGMGCAGWLKCFLVSYS